MTAYSGKWGRIQYFLLVGFLVDLAWHYIFGFMLPSHVTGVIGGLMAVPLWDILKRILAK